MLSRSINRLLEDDAQALMSFWSDTPNGKVIAGVSRVVIKGDLVGLQLDVFAGRPARRIRYGLKYEFSESTSAEMLLSVIEADLECISANDITYLRMHQRIAVN